jgi:hypothetical protein
MQPISPNKEGMLLACFLAFGQAIVFHAMAVAVKPVQGDLVPQPGGSDFSQDGCRAWRSVSPTSSSRGIGAHRRQHMSGIAAAFAHAPSTSRAPGTVRAAPPLGEVLRHPKPSDS